MIDEKTVRFVSVLTVMVDYGNAPFLWLADRPEEAGVGGLLCDGTSWDKSLPMSEGLWQKFSNWAIEFDRTSFYSENFNTDSWDWIAFHARGMQLSRWLKDEVGPAYRVVYVKPCEDPNHRIDERTEILAGGGRLVLNPFLGSTPEPVRFCQRIVSGGQTGADRGALDFAIEHGYTHGGWAPHGREAEDGKIPLKYQLRELDHGGYRQRTRRNVEDSDGTLIINLGELDGGTLATQVFALRLNKPCQLIQLEHVPAGESAARVIEWLRQHGIKTLNVAGPRESKRPGIHRLTRELLIEIDASNSGLRGV